MLTDPFTIVILPSNQRTLYMRNQHTRNQPKPDSKEYSELISEVKSGIIKVPKFQREFIWSIEKTAKLLDSILKGYPIGTFILWETSERLNEIKNIGNLEIPATPENRQVQYVLDGQQRITSLYAAYLGAQLQRTGEKKLTNYQSIVVNIDENINDNDSQVITAEPTGEKYIPLSDVLSFSYEKGQELSDFFSVSEINLISEYFTAFKTYKFSIIFLRQEDIDSAIEVFTRINTGGQTLTLFEIMVAKTYDEPQGFDMQTKWDEFTSELKKINYEGVSGTAVLSLLALVLSQTKECKRKTILTLSKQDIIDSWDEVISALKYSIDYFRTTYRIPVSKLLPYDSLLVPFAYFFHYKKDKPNAGQRKYLEEFFWRMALSSRYSSSTESKLAQDIKRVDKILANERPDYSDIRVYLDSPQNLIDTSFSASNSYCKAILCLLAYHEPKDFQDNSKVILDNSWLKVASSKNYHHFFPKAYLKKKSTPNENSLVNITFVSNDLNKRRIGSKAPSTYIGGFNDENAAIDVALKSHLIEVNGYGIESDDYQIFLQARASRIYSELKSRIELTHTKPDNEDIKVRIAGGESETIEFKLTLRYDLRQQNLNKKLEYVVAKTIAAFLNCEGGSLFIGVDDNMNALGLNNDLSTFAEDKRTIDRFELQLLEVIRKYIGNEYTTHIKIRFPTYDDYKICHVRVSKSSKPVFVKFEGKEDFFVRSGCSSQPLSREEQSAYEKEHWKQ